ncbi:cobalt-precorrin-5B (C(1))-methyltransferase [Methanohalobium sp.]|uniref:cobalt-precorrin-5B (C(1))-methyltransferase n=1 Tax=Methanohalobium sp. TaxID=2837493 RepID=UPI0025D7039B|nr:cobalt-precorrin-5B (C(1))-methyltransferase [Methanohalobium sp.]
MIDPVNNTKIPDEWIERASIPREELIEGIKNGLLVVLSDGSILKRGYTTGTTAAIAAKAAVLSLRKDVDSVTVPTPVGLRARMEVDAHHGHSVVSKLNNDHESDITRGIEFEAYAMESDETSIFAGEGIGTVIQDGLQIKKGNPAINPRPMQQIQNSVCEAVEELGINGVRVKISLPRGADVARNTLNDRIGITGGISILGSTGFVEPWSDHLGEMKEDLLKTASKVVITTGRIGVRFSTMLFPDYTVVLFGSRISEGLEAATGNVIICGLPGLILKWGDPDILTGSGYSTVSELVKKEPEGIRLQESFEKTIKKAEGARVVIVNREGEIIKDSEGDK